MKMRQAPLALALLLLAGADALSAAQAPPVARPADVKPADKAADKPAALTPAQTPSFPAHVEQGVVDVVVTDKKGNPIRGLKREDMTVLEDGVPQQVTSFEAVT